MSISQSPLVFRSNPTSERTESSRRAKPRPRVAIVCTGLGRIRRGFETLANDLFAYLLATERVDVWLYKGGGQRVGREFPVPNIHRDSRLNKLICRFLKGDRRLSVEYLSFCASLGPLLITQHIDAVYTLEPAIYKFLVKWRRLTRSRFALIHSTSGQLADIPVEEPCFIHHCTPCYVNKADALGFSRERQFVIPQFLDLRSIPPLVDEAQRAELRLQRGLPQSRPIILSVGSLDTSVKRMDYVVEETARLKDNSMDPYLIMLGQVDPETDAVREVASRRLGSNNFRMETVTRDELWNYYRAADVFSLASLREGFGFVYVEALAAGLPVIAHDHDVARYVLGEHGTFGDLENDGTLSVLLERVIARSSTDADRLARRQYVQERFDWSAVSKDYVDLFSAAASVGKAHSNVSREAETPVEG